MENEKKEFTGIWVPVEVLELDSVTGNEMILLSYIIGLSNNERGCYATNKHLGERLGLSKGRISEMVSSLFNKGLIEYKVYQDKGNERAIFPNLDTYKGKPLHPIPENEYTYKEKTVNPIPEKAKHNSKVYSKRERKEEREALSHFEFLKNNYSDEIDKWVKESGGQVFNKDLFKESFNNDMIERGKKKDEKLIYSFKKYARHWIRNQKENERPINPIYRKRIS